MATADVQQTSGAMIGDVRLHGGHPSQRDGDSTPRETAPCRKTEELGSRMSSRQRRRSRDGGIVGNRTSRTSNPVHHRSQLHDTRRASESALLPPIRLGIGTRHPSESSPTHDANVTSSPTSNVSCPLNMNGSVPVMTALLSAPESDKDTPRSPINRKAATPRSKMSGNADSPETPRLSPVVSSELIRQRAERRVLKSVNDAMNDVTSVNKAPGGEGGGGVTFVPPSPAPPTKPQNVTPKGKLSRRISTQSLPKLVDGEEPFSIRRKIEQFRKWHEEQYSEKLKKLRVESETERQREASSTRLPNTMAPMKSVDVTDFAKYLEQNINSHSSQGSAKVKKGHAEKSRKDCTNLELTFTPNRHQSTSFERHQGARCKSGATWRTWRDVNDSYAYENVNKYIEENELLPPDRVNWIEAWLRDVEKALGLGEDDVVTAVDPANGEVFM